MWFAFKIYIFDILIQLGVFSILLKLSCDLLSKFISLIFWYNKKNRLYIILIVVICFQNLYLWYSDTTVRIEPLHQSQLWFAFKIYIFDILIQQIYKQDDCIDSCDLLSNFISLIFWYNKKNRLYIIPIVVICFQILYLWYSDTTKKSTLYYSYSCDLLSNFISLIFWYNEYSF